MIGCITLAFFGVFFVWPVLQTLRGGLYHGGRFTFSFVLEVFRNPIYREGLANSLALAVATTAVVALLALPFAYLATRYEFPGKGILSGLILVPMILPPFVGAIGMRQMLGQYGAVNALLVRLGLMSWTNPVDWLGGGRFWAVVFTQALHLYPIFYLNAAAALSNVDPAMEEAAENLGCSGLRRFWRVTLPLTGPGLFAGGTIVFIWAFTELGTPLMFDYTRVAAVQIFDGIKDIGRNPFPYALVLVVLVASAGTYATAKLALGRHSYGMLTKGGSGRALVRLRGPRAALASLAFTLLFLLAALPHVGVLLTSCSRAWYRTVLPSAWTAEHYLAALGHGITLGSIRNSLQYASCAVVVDVLLGIAIAYVVVRSTLRWRGLLDAMAMLPLAVPGIVMAFGYIAMSQPGRVFAALNPGENPTALLIVAYAVRRLPYVVRSVVAGLQQVAPAYEEAAQNLGCPPGTTLRKITLPLISANLMAGALLAFSFAMLEVSDSLMLAQRQMHFPITKALYELFQLLGNGRLVASALGSWAMVFLATTIVSVSLLLGKRMGTIFRI